MNFFSDSDTHIDAECTSCGKVLHIKKERCTKTDSGYSINPAAKCFCGEVWNFISGHAYSKEYVPPKEVNKSHKDERIKCPKCSSEQLTANKKGFGFGKAIAGGLVAGPVGLLGGFIGSRKIYISCLKCGNKWIVQKK